MEVKKLLHSLEERLVQHNSNRKEIQSQLEEICSKIIEEADLLEEKINKELQSSFNSTEERTLNLIEKLNTKNIGEEENDLKFLIQQARDELFHWQQYEIIIDRKIKNFVEQYNLKITQVKKENSNFENENSIEIIVSKLQENLNNIHESVNLAQNKIAEICTERRNKVEEIKERINNDLQLHFIKEDERIQEAVNMIKTSNEITKELIKKVKLTLLIVQKYSLFIKGNDHKLIATRKAPLRWIDFKERKPSNITPLFTNKGELSLSFTLFSNDEINVLKTATGLHFKVTIKMWEKNNKSEKENVRLITKEYNVNEQQQICFTELFKPNTTYCMKMRFKFGSSSKWSDDIEFTTPEFKDLCVWKEFPEYVEDKKKYFVDENNPRIASKGGYVYYYCRIYGTIIGNTLLPLNKVTSWNIKILKTNNNDGSGIYIGVAPFDINQNKRNNYKKYGWYFYCRDSTLCSGPPHNYPGKEYGPRKKDWGNYVHDGDTIGVIMDTSRGELSFVLNGVNCGVAYEGIPLDKPLVPCVLLGEGGNSVELDTSEINENKVDSIIPIPSSIIAKCDDMWGSITLMWDAVEGASFYQIEIDESKFLDATTSNRLTKRGLLGETEYNFRVRAVRDIKMSEWSEVVKAKTTEAPDFSKCVWEECSYYVDVERRYSVDKNNPRIIIKTYSLYTTCCTIVGNTPLPLNKVTSWSIRILKSWRNNGYGIFIGVAPFDIDRNEKGNFNKCGWYFDCYYSRLNSGLPHNYNDKKYGPRKKDWGNYVHTGDTVGVVMDTTKGELSFALNGVNLGVAFEGIPLDKPLVPCVLLREGGDSVELDLSEVEENVNASISVPSNITIKSNTWDSITLTWDAIDGATLYQIEADGGILCNVIKTNTFTKRKFLPETEHFFRIRTVKDNAVSEWSSVMKGRTLMKYFESSGWKECPYYVKCERKYAIDENNSRILTKISNKFWDKHCTIIGNTLIPLNKATSWNIKILKSWMNNGSGIYNGLAPSDINQNDDNYNKCGWYFDCYGSALWSGPPHNYPGKEYGPRKEEGKYVHEGDCVGVMMDIIKGNLSFIINGMNYGVAYEGISLDKPLVPCVILYTEGDSVELGTSSLETKFNIIINK